MEGAGVIAASVVSAVLLLCLFIGLAFFCFYRKGGLFRPEKKTEKRHRHRKNRHVVHHENGYLPPPYYDNRYIPPQHMNGYVKKSPGPMPVAGRHPAFIEPPPIPVPYPAAYATYHGPPPAIRRQELEHRPGTLSGPPPIVIKYGTVTVRPDPRPVIHKTKRRTPRDEPEEPGERRKSPERRPPRQSQEFVVQQSYDGIPVIRPVIYVDDDDDRGRKRSKSRDHRFKKKADKPSPSPKIREINTEDTEVKVPSSTEAEVTIEHQPLTPPPSRGVTSAERSRASSVTEAVNALRKSVNAYDTDSVSSRAPSFRWMQNDEPAPAPAPVAGDVMFFPAGTHVETKRHEHWGDTETRKDDDYVYTQVIKQSVREDPPKKTDSIKEENIYGYAKVIRSSAPSGRDSPVAVVPSTSANEGYEVPVRRSTKGTRDEDVPYETEHSHRTTVDYSKGGASMSDRLQHMVEDGDKTRFSHYNLGAMNFGTEGGDEIEPVQLRVKPPETPPNDIPRSSFYSQSQSRPKTPPNDIPLVSPRESTEVPPLILPSAVTSPRDPYTSYRPATPPTDFHITPRPPTPPLFFSSKPQSARPETPPFDGPNTSRSAAASPLNQSLAVDPSTGEPGSFQARARFIEAQLKRNQGGPPAPKPSTTPAAPRFKSAAPAPPRPSFPTVQVTPGVVPPAPPPPPVPK